MSVIISIARDEDILLPLWLKHHSPHFDEVHVFNHESKGDSFKKAHEKFDFIEHKLEGDWRQGKLEAETVAKYQKEFFKKHKQVVFCEMDEFLVCPNMTLREYVKNMKGDYSYCTGREILQVEGEKDIDWTKPLLQQRKYWWAHPSYFKPCVSTVEQDMADGMHYVKKDMNSYNKEKVNYSDFSEWIKANCDPEIWLIHLQKIDWKNFCIRGRFINNKQHFTKGDTERVEIPEKFKEIL